MRLVTLILFLIASVPSFRVSDVGAQGVPLPFRVGGTVTVDGVALTEATDDGLIVKVTRGDGKDFTDVNGGHPEDKDGLNASNWYVIDVPMRQSPEQPGGASPGDKALIEVHMGSRSLKVLSPAGASFQVGAGGETSRVDIEAQTPWAGTITVTSPDGGEEWSRGSSQLITWTHTEDPGPFVKVELLKGTAVDSVLTPSYPIGDMENGSFNWHIPAGQALGSQYRIRVTSTAAEKFKDVSNSNFSVVAPAAPKPNLTPFKPADWSDKIVVSSVQGTNTDEEPLFSNTTLYVDWAVENNGNKGITTQFYSNLYVDGVEVGSWYTDSLEADYYAYVNDFAIGPLAPGSHRIAIVSDSAGVIPESDETDNKYTKTIEVIGTP